MSHGEAGKVLILPAWRRAISFSVSWAWSSVERARAAVDAAAEFPTAGVRLLQPGLLGDHLPVQGFHSGQFHVHGALPRAMRFRGQVSPFGKELCAHPPLMPVHDGLRLRPLVPGIAGGLARQPRVVRLRCSDERLQRLRSGVRQVLVAQERAPLGVQRGLRHAVLQGTPLRGLAPQRTVPLDQTMLDGRGDRGELRRCSRPCGGPHRVDETAWIGSGSAR